MSESSYLQFGLNRDQCEVDLEQKSSVHHGGYYGPWGRNRTSPSSNASSTVTSPQRELDSMSPTSIISTALPINRSSTPTTIHNTTAFHYVGLPEIETVDVSEMIYASPETTPANHSPPPNLPPADFGWHPSVTNGLKAAGINPNNERTNRNRRNNDQDPSALQQLFNKAKAFISPPPVPNSAPVIFPSKEDFPVYQNQFDEAQRRWSEDMNCGLNTGALIENYDNFERQFAKELTLNHSSNSNDMANCTTGEAVMSTSIITTSSCSNTTQTTSSSSQQQQIPGVRHVSSVYITPSLPHGAHHAPCPSPSNDDGEIPIRGRSYTSVNLQLRQPSSDPQPPINIQGSGSALTYSTSSLDHRCGARSSLQISIGPGGGTISAMRTNVDNKSSQPNTAFHIQYNSADGEGASTPTAVVFPMCDLPTAGHSDKTLTDNKQNIFEPFVEPEEDLPHPVPQMTSLPEATGPPYHFFHYPPTSVEEEMGILGYATGTAWVPDPAYTQGRFVLN